MQVEIREASEANFPDRDRFVALHENGELRDPDEVAREIWSLLDQGLANGTVVDLHKGSD
jgi:hypothetical protein